MKTAFKKKKIYLITVLSLFCLLFLVAGIYLLAGNKSLFTKYNIDKYPDVNNWCTNSKQADTLSISCNGLLLSIQNTGDNDSCFDTQIITNNKELKNLTICENSSSLEYTNDILGYKVLMPINIKFNYAKKFMNSYTFQSVSFEKMDESYIQSIVNEDIANLVIIDPNSTTIKNSVDFCPKPETLPDYITTENKSKYAEFFNKNTLVKDKYLDSYFYSWSESADENVIRILFACDSANNIGYEDICNLSKLQAVSPLPKATSHITVIPQWNMDPSNSEEVLLKEISLIYDSMYLNKQQNKDINLSSLNSFINKINSMDISETVFCGIYKIYNSLTTANAEFSIDETFIEDTLMNNLFQTTSPICSDIVENRHNNINEEGLYLRDSFSIQKTKYEIFNSCHNLENIIK